MSKEIINKLLDIEDSYRAPDRLLEILLDKEKRIQLFEEFIDNGLGDMSKDTFLEYFQSEHAERKTYKQDFTPSSIGALLSSLTSNNDGAFVYDGCAGTGSLVVQHFQKTRIKDGFFVYDQNNYYYTCEELSSRAIPFLLFNLAFRGLNATVLHIDVLTRECYGVFFIQNNGSFSNINVMPYSEQVEKEFGIKFIEKLYPEHIENEKKFIGELVKDHCDTQVEQLELF